MNNKVIIGLVIVVIVVAGAVFLLKGKGTEKAVEQSTEKATGGQANVDLDKNSIKVNTNEGAFEIGKKVSLPSGFPSDVPITDGTITSATTITQDEAYSVTIESTKSVSEVKTEYESKLPQNGWIINASTTFGDNLVLNATKDNRTLGVSIIDNEGKTLVTLTVAKSEPQD